MAPGTVRNEVHQRLVALLSEIGKVPVEVIVDSATIDDQLRMDSVAFLEIQVAIEDHYNIEIDPVRIVELNAFGAIVDYVSECVGTAAS